MRDVDIERARVWARETMREHDPDFQKGNPYSRCALCHYVSHPCDAYEMAELLAQAIEHIDDLTEELGWA